MQSRARSPRLCSVSVLPVRGGGLPHGVVLLGWVVWVWGRSGWCPCCSRWLLVWNEGKAGLGGCVSLACVWIASKKPIFLCGKIDFLGVGFFRLKLSNDWIVHQQLLTRPSFLPYSAHLVGTLSQLDFFLISLHLCPKLLVKDCLLWLMQCCGRAVSGLGWGLSVLPTPQNSIPEASYRHVQLRAMRAETIPLCWMSMQYKKLDLNLATVNAA